MRSRRVRRVVVTAALLGGAAISIPSGSRAAITAPGAVARPDGKGDQVIAYYDARDGFTSFISLRNESTAPLNVGLLFDDTSFGNTFSETIQIAPLGLVTIDVGALRAQGLASTAGVAFATTVNAAGAPIVSRALAGSFTIANLATSSAWGAPALARSAVEPSARQPAPAPAPPPVALATVIDGSDILLPPIQPGNADLAAYFDPQVLANGGGSNQLIFIGFEDVPGPVYSAKAGLASWTLQALDKTGNQVAITTFDATGIVVTDLASVAGPDVNGASGSITFIAAGTTKPLTRLIFFTESLGPFTTGYLLPRTGRS